MSEGERIIDGLNPVATPSPIADPTQPVAAPVEPTAPLAVPEPEEVLPVAYFQTLVKVRTLSERNRTPKRKPSP